MTATISKGCPVGHDVLHVWQLSHLMAAVLHLQSHQRGWSHSTAEANLKTLYNRRWRPCQKTPDKLLKCWCCPWFERMWKLCILLLEINFGIRINFNLSSLHWNLIEEWKVCVKQDVKEWKMSKRPRNHWFSQVCQYIDFHLHNLKQDSMSHRALTDTYLVSKLRESNAEYKYNHAHSIYLSFMRISAKIRGKLRFS